MFSLEKAKMILFFYFTEENYCQHYVSSKGFSANCCALWTKLGNDSPFPESQWFLSDLRLHFLKINLRGDWLDLCTNLELPQTHETICNIRNWKSVSENAFAEKKRWKRNENDVKNDVNHRYLLTMCYQLSCYYCKARFWYKSSLKIFPTKYLGLCGFEMWWLNRIWTENQQLLKVPFSNVWQCGYCQGTNLSQINNNHRVEILRGRGHYINRENS